MAAAPARLQREREREGESHDGGTFLTVDFAIGRVRCFATWDKPNLEPDAAAGEGKGKKPNGRRRWAGKKEWGRPSVLCFNSLFFFFFFFAPPDEQLLLGSLAGIV